MTDEQTTADETPIGQTPNDEITNDQTTGEFTAYCSQFYKLTQLHAEREASLQTVLMNAPHYLGQTLLSEVDEIIAYYRRAQADKAELDKTFDDIKQTERVILNIMRHFGIPPGTILSGLIPDELEYEISIDENDTIYITKTNDLQAVSITGDFMTIKFAGMDFGAPVSKKGKGKR